jgi:hypothetical protein
MLAIGGGHHAAVFVIGEAHAGGVGLVRVSVGARLLSAGSAADCLTDCGAFPWRGPRHTVSPLSSAEVGIGSGVG